MGVWIAIGVLGVVKLTFAGLMLWLPFRDDNALDVPGPSSSDDDGGSKVAPQSDGRGRHPRTPLPRTPRWPRRGPHGMPAPASPPRTRVAGSARLVRDPCRR